jgi:hypothetical protein
MSQPALIVRHPHAPVPALLGTEEYDRSIALAKAAQFAERIQAAKEMGVPRDLVELLEVFGVEQMETWWARIMATVKQR